MVNIGGEEGHTRAINFALHDPHEAVERHADGRGPFVPHERVSAIEVTERNAHLTVFGLAATGENMATNRGGQVRVEIEVIGVEGPGRVVFRDQHRDPAQPVPGPEGWSDQAGFNRRRGGIADHGLARARGSFHLAHRADVWTRQHELVVRIANEEATKGARVHAGGHAQGDASRAGIDLADMGKPFLHCQGGGRGPGRVIVAGEHDEQRVTAELQQAPARRIRKREQRAEARLDRVGDLFRAELAVARQSFGHLGETGNVDEQQ